MRGKVIGFVALVAILSLPALGADDHENTPLAALLRERCRDSLPAAS